MTNYWMLEPGAMHDLIEGRKNFSPSASEILAFNEAQSDLSDNPILRVEGSVANIEIQGTLTPRPSFLAAIFGGGNTAYSDIIDAVSEADSSPAVKQINLNISSPGGTVEGMFDAMDIIAATNKKVTANVKGVAASAAYGLASQADKIVASNDTVTIGSVGTVIKMFIDDDVVSITSQNAPNKAPDPTTEEGKQTIQKHLNDIESAFTSRIATGRAAATNKDITQATVNSDFGRGGVFLSAEAKKAGMIDSIVKRPIKPTLNVVKTTAQSAEILTMTLDEIKAQYPQVFAEIVQIGKELGAAHEKSRCAAHLKLAKGSKDFDFATACITDGTEVQDPSVYAHHMSATMAGTDLDKLKADDVTAADKPKAEEKTTEELNVDAVFSIVDNNIKSGGWG